MYPINISLFGVIIGHRIARDASSTWTYDDQDWGKISDYCDGQAQSPINIITEDAIIEKMPKKV